MVTRHVEMILNVVLLVWRHSGVNRSQRLWFCTVRKPVKVEMILGKRLETYLRHKINIFDGILPKN